MKERCLVLVKQLFEFGAADPMFQPEQRAQLSEWLDHTTATHQKRVERDREKSGSSAGSTATASTSTSSAGPAAGGGLAASGKSVKKSGGQCVARMCACECE